jgi:hypothetical protein
MFAITRNHRSSTLSASILARVALSLALGRLGSDAPATPQPIPAPVAAERSVSGKIVDRLPGSAPVTPRFAEALAQAQWSMATGADHDMALASISWSDSTGIGQAGFKPPLTAAARSGTQAPKPVHVAAARLRREPSVVAISPPPRPAVLRAPQPAVEVAAVPDKRPSVTARMIAFVGSLASLAHPL